ncbi:hypothetical protein SAMN05216229_102124 [Geopseudomonas sagittaria]|uniref:Uncharacterized protein n=1 Tax=Geopseudomonas sagittaria TaxID=1135990 RepID=A0A1I5Q0Q7_9GAMM|nr:hypothetical protein [Pseudomonas sagittaria]SFP39571.1 hypothetical protein SAMN05216229_102124 [Pseudomonas sagittaria]
MSLDAQASALMTLANSALSQASDVASRIVRVDANFSTNFSHTITDSTPALAPSTDLASLVGTPVEFNYTATLPAVSAPSDPSALLVPGAAFDHAVSAPSLATPGDTSLLLGTDLRFNHTVSTPAVAKPGAPVVDLEGEVAESTLAWLDGQAEVWFTRFFPELAAANANKDKPEQWLWGVISGTDPFGIAPAAFTAIWNQARDREYRARNSASDQIRQEFSARGFTLPPGAMVGAIARSEEAAADAIAGVNLAQMIRESEIKVDLLKFAEEQALRLKAGVMQSLADFYRQWISLPDKSYEKGRLQVAAYDSLQRALGDYYQVETRFEELRMKAAELRATGGIEESKLRVSAYSTMNEALTRYQSGEISLEELKLRAEQLRSTGALEESKLKVSTYGALQNAMSDYYRIQREYEALRADLAKVGVDAGAEVGRLKVAAYSALQGALTAYLNGKISIEELKLSAKKLAVDGEIAAQRNNATVTEGTASSWNAAYGHAANAFAEIAGQAASAASTLNAQITSG